MTLENLELFCGSMTNMDAQVVARLRRRGDGDWRLLGEVRGPRCKFTRTLTSTFELRASDGGPWLMATANIIDPCFWSPELPFVYEVHVELRNGDEIVDATPRLLAIRPLGVQRETPVRRQTLGLAGCHRASSHRARSRRGVMPTRECSSPTPTSRSSDRPPTWRAADRADRRHDPEEITADFADSPGGPPWRWPQ